MKRFSAKMMFLLLSTLALNGQQFDPDTFQIDFPYIQEQTSSYGLSAAANEEFERSDRILNYIYQEILFAYRNNPNFTEQLVLAQRAWLEYRNLHLNSVYPYKNSDSNPLNYGGNGIGYGISLTMAEITWQRVLLLYKWIDDNEGGFGSDGVYVEEY